MSASETHSTAAARDVQDGLKAADRRRRAREASRKVWRAAPAVGVATLVVAAIARWAGWPAVIPLAALSIGVGALIAYTLFNRRPHALSDAAATAIDGDAEMGGELRSANWFASRDRRDDWAEFHLERAAERVRAIDWARLYPAINATRSRVVSAVMVAVALVLSLTIPERVGINPASAATPSAVKGRPELDGNALVLTPELQQQLSELLAAAESGNTTAVQALAQNAELRDLLSKLSQLRDPALLEALARAMAATADLQRNSATEDLQSLADRARKAAESAALSKDLQEALDKLAMELELAKSEEANESDGANAAASSGAKPSATGQTDAANGMQDLSIQFAKDANPGGGAGVMMMPSQDGDQSNGPPGAGVGGSGSQDTAGTTPNIEAALKEELVEANQDNPGTNVDTEIRRKTEQGNATVAFTHGASGKFDQTHIAAPPPVPDARRTGVQTYFVRKQ